MMKTSHPMDRLFARILSRKKAKASKSYTARLLRRGIAQCAKKLGEESVETALAAVGKDKRALVAESADLLYHLLVVWAAAGITPKRVYRELARREDQSGLEEKAARKVG
ncbi:MAG: phosphoribosyl-ATP diphosphatase [Alphaproteobacteria bacterium]|nr:phosphoribosyl-ATP diphosphatase [Alphaproteobacteria bacterium]